MDIKAIIMINFVIRLLKFEQNQQIAGIFYKNYKINISDLLRKEATSKYFGSLKENHS